MRALPIVSLFVLTASACPGTTRPTIRALPTTLSTDAAQLLAGCEVLESTWNLEARCGDLVVTRHAQPPALEATWLGVATDRGYRVGARTTWTDRMLVTDDGPVPLREARFIGVEGDADLGALLGVTRDRGSTREDLWCSADVVTDDVIVRCEVILTALLQPPPPTSTVDETPLPDAPTKATNARVDAPRLRGRALSLPRTCGVQLQDDTRGTYRCLDVTLGWRVADDIDAAATEADALLASLATDEEPTPLPCRFGDEASVCRGTSTVVVGTASIDGLAIVASCVARDGDSALVAAPCKTLLNGGW